MQGQMSQGSGYGQSVMQPQMSGDASSPQVLMQEFEEMNSKYFNEVTKAVNSLVDSKVAVHQHDKILDDQIDDFKERLTVIDGNISAMQQENE